ncbi:MAG TPA: carboxypeptidase regulatory-like domain-containing protein [Terriglobia bacterium]
MKRLALQGVVVALSLVCGVGLSRPVFAQTAVSGTISGVISDSSGAVIPDVSLTVTNAGTQLTRTTTTNPSGYYTIPSLPAGDYEVKAEKEGFQTCLNKSVHLDPAATLQVNCTLTVGQVTQTVEVTSSAVQVNVTDSRVSRTVDSTQMEELPVNGRNFVNLLGLQPGVVQSFSFNSFNGINGFSMFASQCTQVNGLTGESNALLIDGAPSTRTRANGATVAVPSMDAVSEVNIITTGYMPEYSRAAGGQMVVNLKSGTDQYHGDAYEFVRNNAFDSRNFFAATVPTLNVNDFGFTIGGPVIPRHHKLYFFWSEEWQREIQGNTEIGTVPTTDDRTGDLAPYCQAFASSCPKVPGYLNGVDGLVAGQHFPNNVIPANLFSPNGSSMVGHFYLQPNTQTNLSTLNPYEGGNNEVYNYNTPTNALSSVVKVDYIINDKNHLAVSLRYLSNSLSSPAGSGGGSALLDQAYEFPGRGGTVDLTTTFSPTLLNDFTVSSTEDPVHVLVPGGSYGGNGVDRNSLGVDYPYIIPGGDASKDIPGKIPTLIMSGFEQVSGLPYPSGSTGHIYTIQDVVTKVKGDHTIKGGVWWEHDGENDHDQVRVTPGGGVGNNLNGQFTFNGSNPNSTGSALADTLLGNFDAYSELGYRDYTPWHAYQIGVFGQDSWKMTPRFTLQGGLRWDYFQPYRSNWCNFAMFSPTFYSTFPGVQQVVDPTTGFITSGNPYNGIATPCNQLPQDAVGHFAALGQELTTENLSSINAQLRAYGMQRGLTPSIIGGQNRNFQPRLGFAWDPKGDGKSSIRAGAGIFYNHNTLSDVTLMGGNSPFQLAQEVFSGLADCPGSAVTAQRTCAPSSTTAPQLPIPMTGQSLLNQTPVVYSWNLTAEHMFFNNTLVDVSYVGNRARHFIINSDLNQPAIGTFTNPDNAGINQAALRPYPGIGGATAVEQDANSKYDALQVQVQRRFTNNLQYSVAYTYSKAFDMADSIYAVTTDTYNPRYNWQLAGFNQAHNLTMTYIYGLPFLQHNTELVGKILGGWQISGDVALYSGFPTSVTTSGNDLLGNGVTSVGGTEYAYVSPNCNYRGTRSFTQFFNTSCFPSSLQVPGGLAGTVAPNAIEGPGIDNFDFALMKNGHITERFTYQFRGEFFNIFNHPSFTGVDAGVFDSNFGAINNVIAPRQIQLGLKIFF